MSIVFPSPAFTSDYQGLCNKIADTLNRQDLTTAIPDFTRLGTARIERDMARIKHPQAVIRASATCVFNYVPLPSDFIAVYQLLDQDTTLEIEYVSPEQSKQLLSDGWLPSGRPDIFYTILGTRLRILPPPGVDVPTLLDLWYYAQLPELGISAPTNWVLTRYPDLYLYGCLAHSAPYLKADERIQVWEGAYQKILSDIEVEADRALRSQTKLVAARRSF